MFHNKARSHVWTIFHGTSAGARPMLVGALRKYWNRKVGGTWGRTFVVGAHLSHRRRHRRLDRLGMRRFTGLRRVRQRVRQRVCPRLRERGAVASTVAQGCVHALRVYELEHRAGRVRHRLALFVLAAIAPRAGT